MAKKQAKKVKEIGKKLKPETSKAKPKPKKKETKPKVAPAPKMETSLAERLRALKLDKIAKVKVAESTRPRPKTVDEMPAELVQVPFKRVKPGGVFFHRKTQMTKIADLCPTIKTGEVGLLGLPIEVPVPNGVSHFGTAKTQDGFKFKFNEYENVLAYPICVAKR